MPKNCQLGPVLSYGSEGTVCSGTWRSATAAIKVLTNQYARRVEAEAKLVMSCNHRNIIKYFDLEYEQETAYLAMEYISGGNLFDFIQSKFHSSSYWVTLDQILGDVAEGMIYLHDRHIIQGDLKSHNILLREGNHQAVICDFGISRSLDQDNQTKRRISTAKGTIRWMAPEICTPPPEQSSYESDVWSYGCIILETISAREPWIDQYQTDSLLFRALQRRENAPIFARICANQTGPSHLCQLLSQCCVWSKANRPTFNDIIKYFKTKEQGHIHLEDDADAMSIDCPLSYQHFHREKDDDDPIVDYKENIQRPSSRSLEVQDNVDNSRTITRHQGRLTGEVYTSRGSASGRPIYEGVKGGRYYLTPSGTKVYLHK